MPSRTDTQKFLETIAHERCPCGHLKQRHRQPQPDDIEGTVMGPCRDCDCKGLIDWYDPEEESA